MARVKKYSAVNLLNDLTALRKKYKSVNNLEVSEVLGIFFCDHILNWETFVNSYSTCYSSCVESLTSNLPCGLKSLAPKPRKKAKRKAGRPKKVKEV
jgi:hypothetical protein